MNKLNEELLRIEDIENSEAEDLNSSDLIFNAANKEYNDIKDNLEKDFKDQTKITNDFMKDVDRRDLKLKGTSEMKKLKLSEDLFPSVNAPTQKVRDRRTIRDTSRTIYYKNKRNSLAELIEDELTLGETVYIPNEQGTALIATVTPSMQLDPEEVGTNVDENGKEYIIAWMTEDRLPEAINIAKKYNKEYVTGKDKYVRGANSYIKIYVTDADWEGPYVDPNVLTRKDFKKMI